MSTEQPTALSIPLGDLDIWLEIIKYFEPSLELDSSDEVQQKRRAALKIALLCPGLTGLGLDILWKSMSTLEPIIRVLNSVSTNNKFITYPPDAGCWVPRRLVSAGQRDRVRCYLLRIENFHIQEMNEKETALWATLDAWLGLGTCLLPNLRLLHIAYGSTATLSTWTNVAPLISPTLQAFSLSTSSVRIAEVLATLLLARDIKLTTVIYRGSPSKKLVQSFLHHTGLECLKLSFEGQALAPGSSIPICDLLNKLTHLKELQIDLRTFPITAVAESNLILPNLTILEVTGGTLDIWRLLENIKFPSLVSLKLIITLIQIGGIRWSALCACIARGISALRQLSLQVLLETNVEITSHDLEQLSSLNLHHLRLTNIPHSLTRFDFDRITPLWPNLRALSINRDSRLYFLCADVLIPLAQHSSLRMLELPLNFNGFNDSVSESAPYSRKSPLTDIICMRSTNVPITVAGTLMLVQSLFLLFPNLTCIRGKELSDPGSEQLLNVQAGISTTRSLLQNIR